MSQELFANSARTTLDGSINDSTTTIVVADGSVFPASGDFRLRIDDELFLVTARSGDSLTVGRGYESTTAASHANGADVVAVLTAGAFERGRRECGTDLAVGNSYAFGAGFGNTVGGFAASVCGGSGNTVDSDSQQSHIGAGEGNVIGQSERCVIVGGQLNAISSVPLAFIGGGYGNSNWGGYSFLGGGYSNYVTASYAVVAGGQGNAVYGTQGAVCGGSGNQILSGAEKAFIGGGEANTVSNGATHSAIDCGMSNTISSSPYGFIGSGASNVIGLSDHCGIGAGQYNVISSTSCAFVGSGSSNTVYGVCGAIAGGENNSAFGNYSSVPGGKGAVARLRGQQSRAVGVFSSQGDAQTTNIIVRGVTTDDTPTALLIDGTDTVYMPNGTAWGFRIMVTGRDSGGSVKAFQLIGVADAALGISGSLDVTEVGSPSWDATVSFGSFNALDVVVTGADSTTIKWVAEYQVVEVGS